MTEERWQPSRLALFLSAALSLSYLLYIAACMFLPDMMSQKLGAFSLAVIAAVVLLFANIIASVLYLFISNRNDDAKESQK